MRPYSVFIHESVLLETPRSRARIMTFIRALGTDPFQRGDYAERDDSGREVEVKILGDHAVTFWTDHAAREVKVVSVQIADGR